jgi:hypothetical protein
MENNRINLVGFYLGSLVLSCGLYVMFWFFPWAYGWLSSDMQGVLAFGGAGARFDLQEWFYWSMFAATLISYIGMAAFRKVFRAAFLGLTVFGLVVSPVYGVSVITGIEVCMIDTSTLLAGVVLGMAYFSPLNEYFY